MDWQEFKPYPFLDIALSPVVLSGWPLVDISTALLAPSRGEAAKGLSVLCPPCPSPTVCGLLDPHQPLRGEKPCGLKTTAKRESTLPSVTQHGSPPGLLLGCCFQIPSRCLFHNNDNNKVGMVVDMSLRNVLSGPYRADYTQCHEKALFQTG